MSALRVLSIDEALHLNPPRDAILFPWQSRLMESTKSFTQRGRVLVLAGITLIFILVAGIVFCFGFSMRIMPVTH